jgi:hypothetical protein
MKCLVNEKFEWLEILEIILHKELIHISQPSTLRLKDVYSFNVNFNQFKQEPHLNRFWTLCAFNTIVMENVSKQATHSKRDQQSP